MMKKATILVLVALVLSLVPVMATVPVIQIQVPKEVTEGDEVTVEITVTHRMNDKNHHINFVWLFHDDKIVEEWTWTGDNFITEDQFTLTYTTVLTHDAVFLAKANCTLHGPDSVTAKVTVNPYVELPKAILVANSIDHTRARSLITFLEDNEFEVIHVTAAEFNQHKNEKLIIILGGVDTSEGVGNVVESVLNEREQELTRLSTRYFLKTDVWAPGQRVFVFSGIDREGTKEAHEEYKYKILE
jgi:desulfoferrodoxin (superoxide reductase-like protein)